MTNATTTDTATLAIPAGNPIASTSADVSGVLRDYAAAALKQFQDAGSIARDWGTNHPVLDGPGDVQAEDVLRFLQDGFAALRERTAAVGAATADTGPVQPELPI